MNKQELIEALVKKQEEAVQIQKDSLVGFDRWNEHMSKAGAFSEAINLVQQLDEEEKKKE